jgi:hypothetical protein
VTLYGRVAVVVSNSRFITILTWDNMSHFGQVNKKIGNKKQKNKKIGNMKNLRN